MGNGIGHEIQQCPLHRGYIQQGVKTSCLTFQSNPSAGALHQGSHPLHKTSQKVIAFGSFSEIQAAVLRQVKIRQIIHRPQQLVNAMAHRRGSGLNALIFLGLQIGPEAAGGRYHFVQRLSQRTGRRGQYLLIQIRQRPANRQLQLARGPETDHKTLPGQRQRALAQLQRPGKLLQHRMLPCCQAQGLRRRIHQQNTTGIADKRRLIQAVQNNFEFLQHSVTPSLNSICKSRQKPLLIFTTAAASCRILSNFLLSLYSKFPNIATRKSQILG